jgi:hypothetical protein
MRYLLFALALTTTGLAMQTGPAAAREYPFCIQSRDTTGHGDCRFTTFEQCQAAIRGIRGGCYANPWVQYYEEEPVRPAPRQRRRAY